MKRIDVLTLSLWAAFALALVASISHLAYVFGELEFDARIGWLAAVAVDSGLAALAVGIQRRKRDKRPTAWFWMGVIGFCGVSAFANVLHALTVESNGPVILSTFWTVDVLVLVKAVILSGVLPLMVVYLGEIVSEHQTQTTSWRQMYLEAQTAGTERETYINTLEDKVRQLETKTDIPKPKLDNYGQFVELMSTGNGSRPTSKEELAEMISKSPKTAERWWNEYSRISQ